MSADLPPVPVRFRWWRVLGWGLLVALLAACGWAGWRAYDDWAAVREGQALGFQFVESASPLAVIRTDWHAALHRATWLDHERVLFLPAGSDLAALRPLLRRLRPTGLQAQNCRHPEALRGLTGLRWLDLSGTGVTDLAPLAGLAQLHELYLGDCTG